MKSIRKALTLLLALAMIFALAACGDGTAKEETGELVYVPAFQSMDDDIGYFNSAAISGDAIYIPGSSIIKRSYESGNGSVTTTEMPEEGEERVPVIYKMSLDGSTYSALENYVATPVPEGFEGTPDIQCLAVDAEGALWVCESMYLYHYDLPAGFAGGDAEKDQYYVDDGQRYFLRRLDETGAETASVDLSEITQGVEYFYMNGLICDKEGNLFFTDGSSTVYCYDKTGAESFRLTADNYIPYLITLSDGTPAAGAYNADYAIEVRPIDVNAKAWGKTLSGKLADNNYGGLFSGGGEYDVLFSTSSKLMGYKAATDETVELFDWLDCNMDVNSVRALKAAEDGRIVCVESLDEGGGEVAVLTQQLASEVTEKTVLKLATLNLGSSLRKEVLKFNKENPDYRITVQDYSDLIGADGDVAPALTKLNTEIIAGNVPDIMDVGMISAQEYVSKGLLLDLYEFMENDPEVTRESLMPSIARALEVDGKLYQASDSFGVFTIMGKEHVVGSDGGWTLDEMMEIYRSQPEGTELFQQGIVQNDILRILCYMYMDSLVDWTTGECNFDTPQFYKLLELCALFDEDFDYSQDNYESEVARIQDGRQMLQIDTLYDFETFQMYEAMFGGKIAYKGFPTESGSGNIGYIENGLAITTKSEHPDGAWQFVRTFLTEEHQEGGSVWYFPTNKAAFDKKLASAMEATYYTDENGEQVEESKGGWGWDGLSIEVYSVKQDEADRILAVIDSVENTVSMDGSITNIVMESAAPYFAGEASAEEVAKVIQSKASLYVSEQK